MHSGYVSQFTDVNKKPREKSRVKGASDAATGEPEVRAASSTRGGRGRGGAEAGRGRGRGSERGRGSQRGGRGGASLNGRAGGSAPVPAATTTTDSSWDTAPKTTVGWDDATPAANGGWDAAPATTTGWDDTTPAVEPTPAAPEPATAPTGPAQKIAAAPEPSQKKSWASMFAKPAPPPAVPKTVTSSAAKATEPSPAVEAVAAAQAAAAVHTEPQVQISEPTLPAAVPPSAAQTSELEPPKDPLTEENVEHLPDTSTGPLTETVASTRGDPASAVASMKAPGPAPIARPAFAAVQKASTPSHRSMSFQRLREQQDAVVMPGNHAVDRATVQFGQMGLGSEKPLDVDDEREDAETRAQPPQQSPSAPRASLPPAARAPSGLTEPAPGLGLPTQQSAAAPAHAPTGPSAHTEAPGFEQYGGRYGSGHAFGTGAPPQKEYDPFSSQLNAAGSGDSRSQYQGFSQAPGSLGHQSSSFGGYNQGPSGFDSQYDQSRYSSNYYGGGYGQQTSTSAAENQPPQRSTSGFGEQSYGATAGSTQSRFGGAEGQASGNNTPNPPMGGQSHQNQHMHSGHGQSGYGGGHPFGNQGHYGYYGYNQGYPQQVDSLTSRHRAERDSHIEQGFGNHYYGQGNYGSYGGKGGMYGQSHHGYGMSSQGSFDHASSPAAGTFGGSSLPGRDSSALSSNLNEYSRSGSTQPTTQTQNSASGGYGGGNDSYGRTSSGFGSHNQGYGAQAGGSAEDSLKTLHEPKTGPSPSLGSSNRPGSGFNANSSSQSGYGPPQGSYGQSSNYPSQQQQQHYSGSGYGGSGLGGLGSHNSGYGSGYGGFGQGGSGNYGGGGSSNRGGWGSQYQYGQGH